MNKKRYRFLLLFLWVNQTHAVDLNSTSEIIQQATEKTQQIEAEINSIIENNQTTVTEANHILESPQVVVETPTETIIMEENLSNKKSQIIEETPIIQEVPTIQAVEIPTETLIVEENLSSEKSQIIEETPIIQEVLTVQIENNQTITTTPSDTNNSQEENNSTLNKETFDMSKGESEEGKKIYIDHIKSSCEMKISKFAGKHEQEEWEAIAEEGKFESTLFEICPELKIPYDNRWSPDLYQFFYENASDSEHIPEF